VIVLGLTGSIGMGKSNAATALRRLGVPVFDADAAVHRLLGRSGAAVPAVRHAFPNVEGPSGAIDRQALGREVFGQPAELRRLEQILHPMVRQAERRFVAAARARREPVVVLDIPLLFETGGDRRTDYVLVVSAPAWLQRQRVARRPGMTDSRLRAILAAQTPDREKRRRADFVVLTGLSRARTLRELKQILSILRQTEPRRALPRRRRGRVGRRR
jgi:dephospho-CoA kinase